MIHGSLYHSKAGRLHITSARNGNCNETHLSKEDLQPNLHPVQELCLCVCPCVRVCLCVRASAHVVLLWPGHGLCLSQKDRFRNRKSQRTYRELWLAGHMSHRNVIQAVDAYYNPGKCELALIFPAMDCDLFKYVPSTESPNRHNIFSLPHPTTTKAKGSLRGVGRCALFGLPNSRLPASRSTICFFRVPRDT